MFQTVTPVLNHSRIHFLGHSRDPERDKIEDSFNQFLNDLAKKTPKNKELVTSIQSIDVVRPIDDKKEKDYEIVITTKNVAGLQPLIPAEHPVGPDKKYRVRLEAPSSNYRPL